MWLVNKGAPNLMTSHKKMVSHLVDTQETWICGDEWCQTTPNLSNQWCLTQLQLQTSKVQMYRYKEHKTTANPHPHDILTWEQQLHKCASIVIILTFRIDLKGNSLEQITYAHSTLTTRSRMRNVSLYNMNHSHPSNKAFDYQLPHAPTSQTFSKLYILMHMWVLST